MRGLSRDVYVRSDRLLLFLFLFELTTHISSPRMHSSLKEWLTVWQDNKTHHPSDSLRTMQIVFEEWNCPSFEGLLTSSPLHVTKFRENPWMQDMYFKQFAEGKLGKGRLYVVSSQGVQFLVLGCLFMHIPDPWWMFRLSEWRLRHRVIAYMPDRLYSKQELVEMSNSIARRLIAQESECAYLDE